MIYILIEKSVCTYIKFKKKTQFFSFEGSLLSFQREKPKMVANTSSGFPYEVCLMPNLPENQQQQMRDFTNYFVRPLGALIALMSFVSNSLVIITVARKKSFQQPSMLMLSSLAVTDFLYAPYALFRDITTLTHEHMCPIGQSGESHSMSVLCLLATLTNVAVISRDRYLAVRKPWWYRHHVTKSRAIKMIYVAWTISILMALLSFFQLEFIPNASYISLVIYFVCFFIIGFSYLGIFLKKNQPGNGGQMNVASQREKRLANTVALILLVLCLTFLPGLILPLALHIAGLQRLKPFRPFYVFLLLLNGFLNPLVNFGRSNEMRRGLGELFKCSREVQPAVVATNNATESGSVS